MWKGLGVIALFVFGCAAPQSAPAPTAAARSAAPATAFASLTASPTPTNAPPCELAIGPATIATPRSKLVANGFGGFPDGIFGTVRDGDKVTWYAAHARPEPSGPHRRAVAPAAPKQSTIGRLVGTLDDLVASSAKVEAPIAGMKAGVDYIGGGPVYRDPASGMLILFYHAERWPAGRSDQFWASYGLAKSTDDGLSWVDLGEVYTPEAPFVDSVPDGTAAAARAVAIPAAAYVVVNGYFYVYSKDRASYEKPTTWLTVARARVTDVVSAAQSGNVTSWNKYNDGAWSEPGLGGKATGLESGNPSIRNSDVAFNKSTGRFVMVIMSAVSVTQDGLYLIESADGITWTSRRTIDESANTKLFPTIVGMGADPRIVGPDFYVYYPRNRQNQSDTDILRRLISCR